MTAGTPSGRHVSRVPSKPVERETDGRYALHLWLRQDGTFDGDMVLRLSSDEAELLHAQLCFALNDDPVTRSPVPGLPVPDCRHSVLGSTGVRWP